MGLRIGRMLREEGREGREDVEVREGVREGREGRQIGVARCGIISRVFLISFFLSFFAFAWVRYILASFGILFRKYRTPSNCYYYYNKLAL